MDPVQVREEPAVGVVDEAVRALSQARSVERCALRVVELQPA